MFLCRKMRVLLRGSSLPFAEFVEEAERSAQEYERGYERDSEQNDRTPENQEDEYLQFGNSGERYVMKKDAR